MKPDSVSWYSLTKPVPNSRAGVLGQGPQKLRERVLLSVGRAIAVVRQCSACRLDQAGTSHRYCHPYGR